MSTRAQVRFATREEGVSFNEHPDKIHAQFYVHSDGYPEGLGIDLANFMCDFRVVNGLGSDSPDKIANGMGCLAAQLIADMKNGPGNVYVEKPHEDRSWIDYTYYIWCKENKGTWISIFDYDDNCIFVGEPQKLLEKYKVNTNKDG